MKNKKKLVVIICGLPGSGKSVLLEAIAKKFRLKAIHTSGILRQMQEKKISQIKKGNARMNKGFWESAKGMFFLKKRLESKEFDKALDKELLRMIKKGNCVMDSWTMPWLSKNGVKIWLKASLNERAKRVALRDKKPIREIKKILLQREKLNKELFRKLYGIDFGKKLSVFDFVLNTNGLNEQQVAQKTIEFILKVNER